MVDAEPADIAIIGAGPAGLAAAEAALSAGRQVVVFEAKPTAARKFLMAGKSGLNLTKAEAAEQFLPRYGRAAERLRPMLAEHGPSEVMRWAEDLGEPIFTGTSGRVFPVAMKGSPLLRRWIARLGEAELRTRWRWQGWQNGALLFEAGGIRRLVSARATVLALGGASWPRLGSDGSWRGPLSAAGVQLEPFLPANMGFDAPWSEHFRKRYAGHAVKSAALSCGTRQTRGEFVISKTGIEGGAVYTLSAALRDRLDKDPVLWIDLAPERQEAALSAALARPRGRDSLANHLRKRARISGVKAGLLRELAPDALPDPLATAAAIKALPLRLTRPRPLTEAISTAGGIAWDALDRNLMLRALPGTFAAGEMIDWEAPTGGYLLTACFATGRWAGRAAAAWARETA